MSQTECIFCRIINNHLPADIVYQNQTWLAFMDIKPVNLGHVLLVPKDHFRNLFDLPDDLLSQAGPLIKRLALAVKEATEADGVNIGWNNEAAAGQLVFHAHIHIMPRFSNDGHKHWQGKTNLEPADFKTMAEKIKAKLIRIGS